MSELQLTNLNDGSIIMSGSVCVCVCVCVCLLPTLTFSQMATHTLLSTLAR